MSGHSKWAQIKRQKGVTDKKRGATFTKLSNAITIAVKAGGGIGDPAQNFKLRLAIDTARGLNMPKENIERAIAKALGKQGEDLVEVICEGFASGGVSVIVEAATNNSMRTTSEIRSVFTKANASFGQPGSVAYQFKHMGQIIAKKGSKTIDDIFLLSAESGAEDIEEGSDDEVYIYTQTQDLTKVKDALTAQGIEIVSVELIRKPLVTIPISNQEQFEKIMNFVEKLEDLEDVQKVYSNVDFQI